MMTVTTFTEKTRLSVPVASLAANVLFLLFAGWRASEFTADIYAQMESLRRDINRVTEERFTMAQGAEQALRLAMENPGIRVPDPRNPGQFFEVRNGVGK